MGAKCDLLALTESFLFERQQRVVLNGQESGTLSFYIYINDLSHALESNVKLFADNTSMFSVVRNSINTSQKLNNDLDKVSLWANK